MANYLVTTKDVYTEEETKSNNIIVKSAGTLKEYQKVIAVGPMVRGVSVGDIICINPKRYAKHKYKEGSLKDGVITENPVVYYNFNVIELDHIPHLLITDQDIDFVIEDCEEEGEPINNIIIPKKEIIV